MKKKTNPVLQGIWHENPVFVLLLGMCPTLGVTTSGVNGLGMGVATMVVLILSNLVISLFSRFIPDKVRIPSFIVIIATFVTIIDFFLQAYLYELHGSLGLFIPLIVVNCIILGRAESFASKNGPLAALLDGLGMGLGFTLALTVLGVVREVLGAGTFSLLGINDAPEGAFSMLLFIMPPGAFLVLGFLMAAFNKLKEKLS